MLWASKSKLDEVEKEEDFFGEEEDAGNREESRGGKQEVGSESAVKDFLPPFLVQTQPSTRQTARQ